VQRPGDPATPREQWWPAYLPPELEHLRRDAEAVARHYDVHRHVDPDAPHNTLVSDAAWPNSSGRCAKSARYAGWRSFPLAPNAAGP
jgi:hypothetical protein